MLFPTCDFEVLNVISSLKNGKSPGWDNISNEVIKYVSYSILRPLVHVINLSFSGGVFPSELKVAKIIPIYKSGDNTNSNYRGILLLPVLIKGF